MFVAYGKAIVRVHSGHLNDVCVNAGAVPLEYPRNVHIDKSSLTSTGVELEWDAVSESADTVRGFFIGYRVLRSYFDELRAGCVFLTAAYHGLMSVVYISQNRKFSDAPLWLLCKIDRVLENWKSECCRRRRCRPAIGRSMSTQEQVRSSSSEERGEDRSRWN